MNRTASVKTMHGLRLIFVSALAASALALSTLADVGAAGDLAARLQRLQLAGENDALARRLRAADILAEPPPTADAVTLTLGAVPPGLSPLGPLPAGVLYVGEHGSRQKWPDTLDEYSRILQDDGDALVPLPWHKTDGPIRRCVQARQLVHLRLAQAPTFVRELYRRQVDAAAAKLLNEGKDQREPRLLRRIVDEYFCSSWTEQALDLLGDMAFERGDFDEAMQWWRRITVPAPPLNRASQLGSREELLVPDARLDAARIRAKQIIAHIFLEQHDRALAELTVFRARHGTATGALAGRRGNYAQILEDLLREAQPFASEDDAWPTFAGDGGRNRVLTHGLSPRLWAGGPAWRVALPEKKGEAHAARDRRPAHYPIVVRNVVWLATANRVHGYEAQTGRLAYAFAMPALNDDRSDSADRPAESRHTLSADQERLYVRLGVGGLSPTATGESHLLCFDLPTGWTGGKPQSLRPRWQTSAAALIGKGTWFEGAPVSRGGRIYLALSRVVDRETWSAVVCLEAASGAPRWLRELGQMPEFASALDGASLAPRQRQHLLTLAGTLLVYCSHAGSIVAVDADTGRTAWGLVYAGRTLDGASSPRDLCPAVFHDRRLFVAPADMDRIFCLDAPSGRVLWERDGIEVVQLLSVTRDRLVFTTPTGLRAVAAGTGLDAWSQPAQGDLAGWGRGLIAGDRVLWPTRDPHVPYRAVHVRDGSPDGPDADEPLDPTRLRQLVPGNMAYGNGCLVIAGSEEMAGYCRLPLSNAPGKARR